MPGSVDLMNGLAELGHALPGYAEAEAYYEGTANELFSSPAIARALAYSRDRYKTNFAKTPVNVVASKLSVTAVTVTTGDTMDPGLTQLLDERVLTPNRFPRLSKSLILRGSEYGDAYAFVWPGTTEGTVTIYYNDPRSARILYDPENPTQALYGIKRWQKPTVQGQVQWFARLYYPDRVEPWVCKAGSDPKSAATWSPEAPIPNPYGRIPIFHLRNDEPYGCPEHHAAYGAQAAIDKASVVMMHSTEMLGFPQRYALTDPAAALNSGSTDSPVWDDDALEYEFNKDDSALTAGPGELWTLIAKTVGQFPPASPDGFLAVLNFYIRAMAQVTETPLHYFDATDTMRTGSIPSGAAAREADKPLVEKCTDRMESYTETFEEMLEFALQILGVTGVQVVVRWKPMVTIDDAEGWSIVAAKIANGVPQRQALLEAGYTADEVDEWLDADSEEMDLGRRIALLAEVSSSLASLGTAVSLGVLTPEQANMVALSVLGSLAPAPDEGGAPMVLPATVVVPADDKLELGAGKPQPAPEPAMA